MRSCPLPASAIGLRQRALQDQSEALHTLPSEQPTRQQQQSSTSTRAHQLAAHVNAHAASLASLPPTMASRLLVRNASKQLRSNSILKPVGGSVDSRECSDSQADHGPLHVILLLVCSPSSPPPHSDHTLPRYHQDLRPRSQPFPMDSL